MKHFDPFSDNIITFEVDDDESVTFNEILSEKFPSSRKNLKGSLL